MAGWEALDMTCSQLHRSLTVSRLGTRARGLASCLVAALLFLSLVPAALAQSPSLTLDERVDKWVVQRVSGGAGYSGDLELSGTFTGSPAAVEARVVSADGATEVVGWTTVDPAPADGSWSGTIAGVPQGGWYRVEARFSDAPEVAVTSAGRFGVGMIVAAIGQSNMVKMFTEDEGDGSLTPPYETPHELTVRYGYGEPAGYEYDRPKDDDVPVSWGDVTGTGGIRLANGLQAAIGAPVLILDFAVDWASVDRDWADTSGAFLGWTKLAAALAEVGSIEAILWHQGATDAQDPTIDVERYKAGLDAVYANVTGIVGGAGTVPMVVAVQNRGVYPESSAFDRGYNAVRRAQLEWIEETPHGFAAGNSVDMDLSYRPGTGSGHFWAYGYEIMANRYASGLLHACDVPGWESVLGGSIAGATVHGDVVVVEVAHDMGSQLVLRDPASDVEGFALTDGEWLENGLANRIEIESAVLSADSSRVEITLERQPEGPLALRYLYGQNPFDDKETDVARRSNGNTLYDDFAYHPSNTGLPINGTTADVPVAVGPHLVFSEEGAAVPEEGTASIGVRLSAAPSGNVEVSVSRLGGDPSISVTDGAALLFTPDDWDTPQPVTFAAAADHDTEDGTATVRAEAPGHGGLDLPITEVDDDSVDPSLLLWLELNETAGTTAFDSSPAENHATVEGSPTLGEPGVSSTSFGFDETDDRLTVPNFAYTDDFTLSLWFRLTDNFGDQYQYLYSQGNFGAANSLNVAIGESGNGDGLADTLLVNFRDSNDATGPFNDLLTADASAAGLDLIDGNWHQLVLRVTAGTGSELYVDGALTSALPTHGGDAFLPPGVVTVATRGYSNENRWLGGRLDELRVYGRSLPVEEIELGYTQDAPSEENVPFTASPLHLVVDPAGTGSFTVVLDEAPTGSIVVEAVSDDPALATASPTLLTFDATDWNVPRTVTVSGAGAEGQTTVLVRRADGGDVGISDQLVSVTLAAGGVDPDLALWLKLNELRGVEAYDSSGNDRHGVISGAPLLGEPGILGRAPTFDEGDDVVTVGDFDYGPELTLSTWFRVDDNSGSGYQYLYSHGDFGVANSLNVALGEASNPDLPNRLVVNLRDGDDATGAFNDLLQVDAGPDGHDLIDGEWHQLVVTVTADGTRLYVDGLLGNALQSHGGDLIDPSGTITVGARSDLASGRWFGGQLDDLRLLTRGLTAQEVAEQFGATLDIVVEPPGTPEVPPQVTCDPERPVDLVILLDLSGSMRTAFPGSGSKLGAARHAIATLTDALPSDAGSTRAALLGFAGYNTVEQNLNDSLDVLIPFTNDLASITNFVEFGLADGDIRADANTPTALGLSKSLDFLLAERDPDNLPVVLLLTDGVPNIDLEGRGWDQYLLDEVTNIHLDDSAGDFYPWQDVALTGGFNPAIATYDGEPLSDAMVVVEGMKSSVAEMRIYGVAIQGTGVDDLGTFNEDLIEYAAYHTGGKALSADTTEGLDGEIETILDELNCALPGTATIGDRVWKDLDADGVQDSGEPGLNGVTVELLDAAGELVTTAVTSGDGDYLFVNLDAGEYTVAVDPATLPADADERTYDLDGTGTLDRAAVTVAVDESQLDVDFGYRESDLGPPLDCPTDGFEDPVLDPEWTATDLGDASFGSAEIVDGRLQISGDGSSLYEQDNGFFLHQDLSGDFRVEVDVTGFPVDQGDEFRKAGLLVRAGLEPGAPRVMATYIADHPEPYDTALQFNFRDFQGGPAQVLADTIFDVPLPVRLAIERRGERFTVYYSTDGGDSWIRPNGGAGGAVNVAMEEPVNAGVAVASYATGIQLTAELDDFAACQPNQLPPPDPPPPVPCDPLQPLDVVYVLDMSGSMTADFPGSGTKFDAAQQAIYELDAALEARGDGSRAALVSFGGFRTPEENLQFSVQVRSNFTSSFPSIDALVSSLSVDGIEAQVTTPTSIAMNETLNLLLRERNPDHLPVVVWLTDGVPNIDSAGLGPEPYDLNEIQAISLYDANGDFLSWGQVQWTGDFNPELGTFDGEPLANTMFEIEELKNALLDSMTYGLALQGDGYALGTFNEDLLEYAAYYSGGLSRSAATGDDVTAAIREIAGDLDCGGLYTADVGGRVWHDADGDGTQGAGEPGLEGVGLLLVDDTGLAVAVAVTDGGGDYLLPRQLPGDYTLVVDPATLPAGVTPTTDPDGVATPGEAALTLTAGAHQLGLGFGYQ